VTTDKRDAIRLARRLAAGELTLVCERRRQGSITKAGSTTPPAVDRGRVPLPAPPGIGIALERRQRDQNTAVINIAWRAQR
jgi:hypothetical protein